MEKCSDPLDTASQMQDQANESALAQRRAVEAKRVKAFMRALDTDEGDGQHCLECDIDIPWRRLANYNMLCTPCAQQVEDQKKRTGT